MRLFQPGIILYIRKTPGKPVHGDDVIAHRATKQVDYLVSYADYLPSPFFLNFQQTV